jgi:hypothetical protein
MATDYYRLRVQGLHQTEYNECVMFFKGTNLDVADYAANARDLVLSWSSNLQGLWNDMLPVSQQTLRLSGSKASAGGSAEVSQQMPLGTQVGTVSGGAASQQLCPVVRLIPGMGVKSAGKIFLPCIAESQVNGNVVQAAWLTSLDALMGDMLGNFGAGSIAWTPVVYSRKNSTFSDVLAYDTSPIIGFQRRRQRSPL